VEVRGLAVVKCAAKARLVVILVSLGAMIVISLQVVHVMNKA
jgi:hypothetical protein